MPLPTLQDAVGAAPVSMTNLVGLPTPPFAVASLVLAIAGMTLLPSVGSVLAVVFGHLTLGQIKSSHSAFGGRGLALAGAVMGYDEVAISLLAGFVLIVWLLVR
ncbi:MAG: DUF4190 domain-containing protein [Planctomycetales bacterium]|nr:DUF4190 domain-containing protein [Planctomycetales bacterium]